MIRPVSSAELAVCVESLEALVIEDKVGLVRRVGCGALSMLQLLDGTSLFCRMNQQLFLFFVFVATIMHVLNMSCIYLALAHFFTHVHSSFVSNCASRL